MYEIMEDGSYLWLLATGIDQVSELEATIHVREGVKFHNGNPLTADDIMFSMELCANDPRFYLNVKAVDMEKTHVVDDYTIDLWYTHYDATQAVSFVSLYIMDKESFDEVYLASHTIGTGPYVLDEYVINSHLSGIRNENYWGEPAKIKHLTFKCINEAEQVVNALAVGDIDYARGIDITDVDYVKDLGYDVSVSFGGYTFVEMFSLDANSPLASKEARLAVAYATDCASISQVMYQGLSETCVFPASTHTSDYDPRFAEASPLYAHGYDMDLAKQYAEESGLVGKTVRITNNGSAGQTIIAQMVQANLIKLGVDAQIITYDNASYFGTIMDATNFDIAVFEPSCPSYMCGDVLANYPDFVPLGWTGEVRDTYGGYAHGAMSTPDAKAAADQLLEAVKIFEDVVPWYAIVENVAPTVISKDLRYDRKTVSGGFRYSDLYFVG
jgi:peptide/nickel transport system substrate-binding protein